MHVLDDPTPAATAPSAPEVAGDDELAARLVGALRAVDLGSAPVVIGIAGGGGLAVRVADALDVPLEMTIVRRLRTLRRPEVTLGVLGEDGVRILDRDAIDDLHLDASDVAAAEAVARDELAALLEPRRGAPCHADLTGRTAIVVDGRPSLGRARVACRVACGRGAARVVLAVPGSEQGWSDPGLARTADAVVTTDDAAPAAGSAAAPSRAARLARRR